MITGKDPISLEIISELSNGAKVKEIPFRFQISLDQSKRLSRYHNMLKSAEEKLNKNLTQQLKKLGLKSLVLSPLFKREDWEGIAEILHLVKEDTKRDELSLWMQGLAEKRERIAEFNESAEEKLLVLERKQIKQLQMEKALLETQNKIQEEIQFICQYQIPIQEFLLKHLGIFDGHLVLSRRLDSRWQKTLKSKGILSYERENFVWFVNDLDALVQDYQNRINRKTPYHTEWNEERERKRYKDGRFDLPASPVYSLPNGLATDLQEVLAEITEEMRKLEEDKVRLRREIKQLKESSPQSFIESIEASNILSASELRRHGELQDKALKWLFKQGYIAASEVTLPNGKRVDVIGYNDSGHIIIIEIKVTRADYIRDQKWKSYLPYCTEFYFLLDFIITESIEVGLLQEDRQTISIDTMSKANQHTVDRDSTIFSINKVLSRKFIYGY